MVSHDTGRQDRIDSYDKDSHRMAFSQKKLKGLLIS